VSPQVQPWQVWWADLDPTEGHEQAGRRPVLVVSSTYHLRVTAGAMLSILPLTTRERQGWLHHVRVDLPDKPASRVLTEQVRTIAVSRLVGRHPIYTLTSEQAAEVRDVFGQMLDI
jgi:mRNA interferase MazF